MKPSHAALGAVVSAFIISIASGSGWVVPHHGPPTGAPPERLGPIELRNHQVDATINDQIATTRVEQVFYNPSNRRLEATYYFPIPHGAHIDRFSMFIDGTEVEGELLDAKKAREIYESIVRQMKDPALLEYAGRGLFRIRVFPFEPRSERRVRLQYTELLTKDGDLVQYSVPLTTGARSTGKSPQLAVKLSLTSKIPIRTLYSPTHDVEIIRPNDTSATIGFESRSGYSESEFKLLYATAKNDDDIGLTLLTHRPSESEDGYFLLLASPSVSAQADDERIIPKDVVFVLDNSGSMSGGKLDQAKRALNFCIDNLNDDDRFEIIRFSTEAEPVFGKLAARTDETIGKARTFINALRPRGMTAIDEALKMAVKHSAERDQQQRPFIVVFLTDGLPTIGERGEDQIIANARKAMREAEANVRIFSFGIGSDVNTYLLDRLSQQTRAVSEYVLANEDIEMKVSRFFTKINDPVLANLELKIEGAGRITKVHPGFGDLPDLFKGDQLVIAGRYSAGGHAAITLAGEALGKKRAFVTEATFAEKATEHDFVPRLWATRRIGYLLDEVRQEGDSKELRDEIAHLARTYGIVTPYTAYLIIEDEERRGVPVARRTVQDGGGRGGGGGHSVAYDEMVRQRSGDSAVAASQSNTRAQTAGNLAHIAEANIYAERGARGQIGQQSRVIRGRAFVQNGEQWIDSTVQIAPDARIVRVQFDSDEYYELLDAHPEAAAWLSVGRNVQILLGDTVYEVYDS